MSFPTSRFGSILVLILALIATVFTPAVALEVSRTDENVTLTIGDSLFVTRDGLAPDRLYSAIVTDEPGSVIAEVTFTPDALDPILVWASSGVVGCDHGADPDPAAYRFIRMEEAEDALKSRTFRLTLLDVATQESVARIWLRMAAREKDLIFFSDEHGCPRCRYEPGESVYVTGIRMVTGSFNMYLLKTGGELPEVGDPLDDALGGPREVKPPSSYFTESVVEALDSGEVYAGAFEPAEDDGSEPPDVLTPTGILVAPTWWPTDDDDDEYGYDCLPIKGIRTNLQDSGDPVDCGNGGKRL